MSGDPFYTRREDLNRDIQSAMEKREKSYDPDERADLLEEIQALQEIKWRRGWTEPTEY